MNSEKILQELSDFPKVYRQSEEQKQNNLRQILDHYEDAPHGRFSLQKLMVGSAGVLAALLACFFVLSNTDILNNNNGEQTHQKQPDVISGEKAFHPDELDAVRKVSISNHEGIGNGEITKADKIGDLIEILDRAVFYKEGELNQALKGESYNITLDIGDNGDIISVQVWPAGKEPMMYEANTNTWWSVKGIENFIAANTVKQSIKYEDVIQIAQERYPEVDWEVLGEAAAIPKKTDDGQQVWKVSGLSSEGNLQMIYISSIDGEILDKKTFTTEDGVNLVNEFFERVNKGELDAAWEMIHPRAKTSSLKIARQTFDDYFTKNKPEIEKVESATWGRGSQKYSVCMCEFSQAIKLKVNFAGVGIKEFHVIRTDEEEEWKLFWSYEEMELE